MINIAGSNIIRFDTEGLSDKEQKDLITASLYYKPEYILSDINNIAFNIEISDFVDDGTGFISTVRANSASDAISFYTSVLISKLKCTEKLAKIRFAKDYDYIIQLEKDEEYFKINSITSITSNKAGTPVLTELVNLKAGEYNFNFNEKEKSENLAELSVNQEVPKKISFSSRFNFRQDS